MTDSNVLGRSSVLVILYDTDYHVECYVPNQKMRSMSHKLVIDRFTVKAPDIRGFVICIFSIHRLENGSTFYICG